MHWLKYKSIIDLNRRQKYKIIQQIVYNQEERNSNNLLHQIKVKMLQRKPV